MIQSILQKLESELVNLASDHRRNAFDQLRDMQLLVIECANALLIVEELFGQVYDENGSFDFVRNRILYYLVYFENEIRKLEEELPPTIEEMKPYYRLAAYQDWKIAFKHLCCCRSITVATQRIVLSNPVPVMN